MERPGVPSGGGGGVEEEGGGGGPGPGAPPAGARPGPSRVSAAAPRPSAPPTPGPAAAAAMARPLVPSSQKALLLELKGLQEEPVEGFRVTLVDEGDLYNWEVAIFGPPNTYYEGGYFKVSPRLAVLVPIRPLSPRAVPLSVRPVPESSCRAPLSQPVSETPQRGALGALPVGSGVGLLFASAPGRPVPSAAFPAPCPEETKSLPSPSKPYCWGARGWGREGGRPAGAGGPAPPLAGVPTKAHMGPCQLGPAWNAATLADSSGPGPLGFIPSFM